MNPIFKIFVITLGLTLNVGCGDVVKEYVKGANPPSTGHDRDPASVPDFPPGLRVSPGAVDSVAGNLRLKASVNLRRAPFTMGNDRKAYLGIGQTKQTF